MYKDRVFLATAHRHVGALTGVEAATGKILWQTKRKKLPNHTSPAVFHVNGKDQILICGMNQIAGFDPETGKRNWTSDATTEETVGTVVTHGDLIYASGGWPKHETVCVKGDGSGDVVWRNKVKIYQPSLLSHAGYIYGITDNGFGYCWDAETGKEMWTVRLNGKYSASPVLVGEHIFMADESGRTTVFKANPEKFDVVHINKLGHENFASPVFCGDRIYMRVAMRNFPLRQEYLFCIGKK
ncbi:MAG: PQQ-binding-like beta-propeller repeat protein [Verrucomicrobiota bacterium]